MNETAGRTFEEAFGPCFSRAFAVALRIVNDAHAAEDIASETMTRAYARWRRVSRYDNAEAWAALVASNLAIDATRRRRSRDESPESGVDTVADKLTSQVAITSALRALPKRQREAVVLCHLEGLTPDEASAVLKVSVNTVRTHTQRGVAALRKAFTDKELAPWTA